LLNDVSDLGGMVGLIYCYREFILGFSPLHSLFHVFKFGLPVLARMKFSFPSSKKQLLGVWWSLGDFMCDILGGGFSSQMVVLELRHSKVIIPQIFRRFPFGRFIGLFFVSSELTKYL